MRTLFVTCQICQESYWNNNSEMGIRAHLLRSHGITMPKIEIPEPMQVAGCATCGIVGGHRDGCPEAMPEIYEDMANTITRQRSEIDTARWWLDLERDITAEMHGEVEQAQKGREKVEALLAKAISWAEFTDEQLDELGFKVSP